MKPKSNRSAYSGFTELQGCICGSKYPIHYPKFPACDRPNPDKPKDPKRNYPKK